MTKAEYSDYETAVAKFLSRNKVRPGCHGPVHGESSPFFSWQHCECCGSICGGTREAYEFAYEANSKGMLGRLDKGPHTFTANICEDCVYYLTYSQLDDLTMLEIEKQ